MMSDSKLPEKYDPKTLLGKALVDLDKVKLPDMIEKNLIRSACRLITGVVDIPVAWLKAVERNISRETEALDLISKSNSEDIAKLNSKDLEFIQSTANYYSLKQFNESVNRRKILNLALDDIKNNIPPSDAENTIDEDWLNRFSANAERTSSEEIQVILAKILRNEINQPGSFSHRALNILNDLDSVSAKSLRDITRVCLWKRLGKNGSLFTIIPTFSSEDLFISENDDFDILREFVNLIDIGILRPNTYTAKVSRRILMPNLKLGDCLIEFDEPRESFDPPYEFEVYSLTRAGNELFEISEKAVPTRATVRTYNHWFHKNFSIEIKSLIEISTNQK